MNYPAASSGVSQKALNAPRGGEYNPKVIKHCQGKILPDSGRYIRISSRTKAKNWNLVEALADILNSP